MSQKRLIQAALTALLVGAAAVGWPPFSRLAMGAMLAFGIANVWLVLPGTDTIRAVSIGVAFLTLLSRPYIVVGALLVWLLWPPAFIGAWAIEQELTTRDGGPAIDVRARIKTAWLIGAVAIASLAHEWLVAHRLNQTAALFVGIPALLAAVIVLLASPRSATGVACKAVTVGLLVSAFFLREGILCVVMTAPLFYAVAVAIGKMLETVNEREHSTVRSCLVLLAVVPFALEGVTPWTTIDRDEIVTASRIVSAPAEAVERALLAQPRFDRVPPALLMIGFPAPVATRIEPAANPPRWTISLRGGEMYLNGMEPRTGDLTLDLVARGPRLVRWRAVSDSSHIAHFLDWRASTVVWDPVDARSTRVTWTLHYRRGLDPAWYFGPLERFFMRLAASYLIDTVAAP